MMRVFFTIVLPLLLPTALYLLWVALWALRKTAALSCGHRCLGFGWREPAHCCWRSFCLS